LNDLAIQRIKEEYQKRSNTSEEPNYEKVDRLTCNLIFFSKLSKSIRLAILQNSTYAYYPAAETIFQQGDYGDMMYVILRGSVNVRVKKKTSYGTVENLIVNTLYDGNHFGDYAIVGKGRRKKKPAHPIVKIVVLCV